MPGSPDTIAALATPPGLGAVAVIRVSGPRARAACEPLVRRWPRPRQAALRRLRDPSGALLDEALLLWFPAPRSFTGEDLVELHTHGGRVAPARVLAALVAQGVRPAAPGEFSRRAFLAGKLGLEQAEAMNELVHAEDEALAQAALARLTGGLRRRVEAFRDRLIDLAALLEANLDFPEEDVPELDPGAVGAELGAIRAELEALAATYARGRVLREGVGVVLAGRPNVGKSSLLNGLLREERAIVTPEAGTTRDLLEEGLSYRGIRIRLVDTAGLREAPGPAEREGVARAARAAGAAAVRVVVTVAGEPWDPALGPLDPARDVLVRNKVDLLGPGGDAVELPPGVDPLSTSATRGEGLESLMEAVYARALGALPPARGDLVVTELRQREALARAAEALARLGEGLAAGEPWDVGLLELYAATRSLGQVFGAVGVEDVLDRVFARFCLGK